MVMPIALAVATGCAVPSTPTAEHPEENVAAEVVANEPLTAEAAWFGPEIIVVRYRDGAHDTYASGALGQSVQSAAAPSPTDRAISHAVEQPPPIVRLVPVAQPPDDLALKDQASVALFRAADWHRLVREVETAVTQQDGFAGTVLDVAQEKEVFLYRDELGEFRSVPIEYKPPDVPVARTVTLDDLLDYALPILGGWLQERGSSARQVLLDTGDTTEPAYAFVLIDLDARRGWFLRPARRHATAKGTAEAKAQAALHAVIGQVRSVIGRPVSSVARLFTLASATTFDTLHMSSLAIGGHEPIPPLSDGPGMDRDAWERELDTLTGTVAARGTLRYLVDGAQFFPRLIQAIHEAEQSIDLRLYIFDNDDYALKIADLLKYRSRKVRVRVLLDALGTFGAAGALPGYTPDYFRGGPSIVNYLREGSDISVRLNQNPWLQGDHTKAIIIDDGPAFVGGMNIGREYRYEWHDLMIEVTGPVVDVIQEDFDRAWINAGLFGDFRALFEGPKAKKREATDEGIAVRVLQTKPANAQILRAQIAAIRKARQRIWIENAYFTSDAILYELAKARRRGVDVRIVMPLHGDSGPINRSNALAANAMLASGVRVYIYPGMAHVKGAVYDGWACFGSANFDKLSLRLNRELDLATSDPDAVGRFVEQVFRPDFERSVELKEPFPTDWSDHLMALIANQL